MKDGSIAPFECIDVFELNHENKIVKLTIIYDTYQIGNFSSGASLSSFST